MSATKTRKRQERQRRLNNRKRRIQNRLGERHWNDQARPMFSAGSEGDQGGSPNHYESSDRTRGLGLGGIGVMHLPARQTGLIEGIDKQLHLLKYL